MFCKYVNLVIFGLKHDNLVNKVKMLLLYPVTLKQLNKGYKGVSVSPGTGLCNLEFVFRYIKLKLVQLPASEATTPPHQIKKKRKKILKGNFQSLQLLIM